MIARRGAPMAEAGLSPATVAAFGSKTRGKILRASLALFDEQGFDFVTTAQIATTADVLEGTLWYHFKTKKDLVLAHLDTMEQRLEEHFGQPFPEAPAQAVETFLALFGILWEFRYLLRDPLFALEPREAILERLRDSYVRIEGLVEDRLRAAEAAGRLDLRGACVREIAANCVMIGRFHMDYARIRHRESVDTELQTGARAIASLLRPYMTEGVAGVLRTRDPGATPDRSEGQ